MRFALIAAVTMTFVGCAPEGPQPLPTAPSPLLRLLLVRPHFSRSVRAPTGAPTRAPARADVRLGDSA